MVEEEELAAVIDEGKFHDQSPACAKRDEQAILSSALTGMYHTLCIHRPRKKKKSK